MSMHEKKQLGQMIRNLPPEYLRGVCQIVSDGIPDSANNKEVLEFDIDLLPVRKVRELERYVKAKLSQAAKGQSKKKNAKKGGQTRGDLMEQEYGHHPGGMSNMGQRPQSRPMQPMVPNDIENNDDIDSKSSESSFITDSDDSDDERRKRQKQKI
mmetsp:Transcript_50844/g.58464  ORF Transcript_50844/g.58464 Transcript_50844/m.58464 type:complete len:155 (+) Transcript_50844:31-495(+)